jgi:hypothetical protein
VLFFESVTAELDRYLAHENRLTPGTGTNFSDTAETLPFLTPGVPLFDETLAWIKGKWGGYDQMPREGRNLWYLVLARSRGRDGDKNAALVGWARWLASACEPGQCIEQKSSEPPLAGSTATPTRLDPALFRHGPDYRDCTWNGERFTLTTTQAACVQTLWEERDKGTLELSQQYILEKSGAESQQLKDVFKKSTAWGTMIVRGSTQGSFRLSEPK